jgi:hypothetical protein
MMFTDGKIFSDLTAMRFYTLDVSSPTIFSWPCFVNALMDAHFPTFLFSFLCDGGQER